MLRVAPLWLVRPEFVVLVRDLRTPLPEIPRHRSLRWSTLTDAEISELNAMHPVMSPGEIRRRWGHGQECMLFWSGDALVHFRWSASRAIHLPYLGKTFQPKNGDILVTEVFTRAAYRRMGIHSVSSIVGMHRARDRGFDRSLAFVASWNLPSLRVTGDKAGYSIAGRVGYWSIAGRRYHFASENVSLHRDTIYVPNRHPEIGAPPPPEGRGERTCR